MTTPTLILTAAALIALGHDAWATAQNGRTWARAGAGARHRRPGLPSVYRRRRSAELVLTFDNRPARIASIPRWDDITASIEFPAITYADRLQAIDIEPLRQLAAGPLQPQAVAA